MRKRKLGEGIEALEADRNALWDALDTLVYIVGLTAFKYEEQRAVLQEALDQANEVLMRTSEQE